MEIQSTPSVETRGQLSSPYDTVTCSGLNCPLVPLLCIDYISTDDTKHLKTWLTFRHLCTDPGFSCHPGAESCPFLKAGVNYGLFLTTCYKVNVNSLGVDILRLSPSELCSQSSLRC